MVNRFDVIYSHITRRVRTAPNATVTINLRQPDGIFCEEKETSGSEDLHYPGKDAERRVTIKRLTAKSIFSLDDFHLEHIETPKGLSTNHNGCEIDYRNGAYKYSDR